MRIRASHLSAHELNRTDFPITYIQYTYYENSHELNHNIFPGIIFLTKNRTNLILHEFHDLRYNGGHHFHFTVCIDVCMTFYVMKCHRPAISVCDYVMDYIIIRVHFLQLRRIPGTNAFLVVLEPEQSTGAWLCSCNLNRVSDITCMHAQAVT